MIFKKPQPPLSHELRTLRTRTRALEDLVQARSGKKEELKTLLDEIELMLSELIRSAEKGKDEK
ncbi:MAG: hypothetical protein R3A80_04315 [Bdellovibrionota bacterium]